MILTTTIIKKTKMDVADKENAPLSRMDRLMLYRQSKEGPKGLKRSLSTATISSTASMGNKRKLEDATNKFNITGSRAAADNGTAKRAKIQIQKVSSWTASVPTSPSKGNKAGGEEEGEETLLQSIRKKISTLKTPQMAKNNEALSAHIRESSDEGMSTSHSTNNLNAVFDSCAKVVTDSAAQKRLAQMRAWKQQRDDSKAVRTASAKKSTNNLLDRRARSTREANENIAVQASVDEADILVKMGRVQEARGTMEGLITEIPGASTKPAYWLCVMRIEEAAGNASSAMATLQEALDFVDQRVGKMLIETAIVALKKRHPAMFPSNASNANTATSRPTSTAGEHSQAASAKVMEAPQGKDNALSLLSQVYTDEDDNMSSPRSADSWDPVRVTPSGSAASTKSMTCGGVSPPEVEEEEGAGNDNNDNTAAAEYPTTEMFMSHEVLEDEIIAAEEECACVGEVEQAMEMEEDCMIFDDAEELVLEESMRSTDAPSEDRPKTPSSVKSMKGVMSAGKSATKLGSKIIVAPVHASSKAAVECGVKARDMILSPCRRSFRQDATAMPANFEDIIEKTNIPYAGNFALPPNVYSITVNDDEEDDEDCISKYLPASLTPLSERISCRAAVAPPVPAFTAGSENTASSSTLTLNRVLSFDVPTSPSKGNESHGSSFDKVRAKRKNTPIFKKSGEFIVPNVPTNVNALGRYEVVVPTKKDGNTPVRRSSRLSSTPVSLRAEMERMLLS